jgi:hypothetical protein
MSPRRSQEQVVPLGPLHLRDAADVAYNPMTTPQTVLDRPGRAISRDQFMWLEGVEAQLRGTPFLQDWLNLVQTNQLRSVYHHPAMVLGMAEKRSVPLLCAHFSEGLANPASLTTLAILSPKIQRLRPIPALPVGVTLRGHRVIGSHFLGPTDQDAADRLVRELTRSLCSPSFDSAFALFEDVEVGTSLWRALLAASGQHDVVVFNPKPPEPHWWIVFPDDLKNFLGQWPSQRRTMLRRKLRANHSIRCFTKPDEVPTFLEQAAAIAKKSWQSKNLGLRIRNDLKTTKLLNLLASLNSWRSYILTCDNRPAAFEFGIQWQGTYFGEETGYDPALSSSSPGLVLLYRVLEDLIARDPPRRFDFGHGDGSYMQLVANRQTMSGPVCLFRRGLRTDLAMAIIRLKSKASGLLRNGLNRVGLLSYFRASHRK